MLLLGAATPVLDVKTEHDVPTNIIELNLEKKCIVTTHRPRVLSICDHVYKIENGQILQVKLILLFKILLMFQHLYLIREKTVTDF